MAGKRNDVIRCSFCGKTQDQAGGKLIVGPNNSAYICYQCVDVCAEIVDEEEFGEGREASGGKSEINLLIQGIKAVLLQDQLQHHLLRLQGR